MAGGSFGGTVKLTGESEYRKALKDITANLKLVSSELKLTNSQFTSGDNTLKQSKLSYDNMKTTLEEQKEKINNLRKTLKEAEEEYGSNNEKVRQFKTQLNNAETQLVQMEDATGKSNKELKNMKKGFDDAGNGALKFGDLLKANVIGDMITNGLRAVGAGIKSIASAFKDIGKQAIESYADYEQLIGGVETLFKDSASKVENYANNAYQTSGLSANEYMETVTSFSASLLQSLNNDTAKSAEVADMAITDMSDNANKMGTDMSMIQNAYQGFAKQNYTMLDNLKLGYGGTKEEMQRLLKDAQQLTGVKYDINNLNDVYQAIHAIQGKLDITGTTAKEASSTISGSISSMKSAWKNLLTGISADNVDFSGLVNNFVESLSTVTENLFPRIEIALQGVVLLITNFVDTLLPQIAPLVINLINNLKDVIIDQLPNIIDTGIELISSLISGITASMPEILQTGITILSELINGISQTLPELVPLSINSISLIAETLLNNIDTIIDAGINLIIALAEGLINAIPQLIEKIPTIIERLVVAISNNAPKLLQMGITLIVKMAEGLIKAIPQLVSKIPQIINSLISGFKNFLTNMGEVGKNIVEGIWQGIKNAKNWLLGKIKEWCGSILNGIKSFFGIHSPSTIFRDEVGKFMAQGVGIGFGDEMENVTKQMQNSIPTEFDINSTINKNESKANNLKEAMIEAFKQFKPSVILNGKEVGEFAFEYGNIKYGKYFI